MVLLLLNTNFSETTVELLNEELVSSERDVFWLSPPAGNLTSTSVLLNERLLELVDNTDLPDLIPAHGFPSPFLSLPSISFGFIVFKSANLHACAYEIGLCFCYLLLLLILNVELTTIKSCKNHIIKPHTFLITALHVTSQAIQQTVWFCSYILNTNFSETIVELLNEKLVYNETDVSGCLHQLATSPPPQSS